MGTSAQVYQVEVNPPCILGTQDKNFEEIQESCWLCPTSQPMDTSSQRSSSSSKSSSTSFKSSSSNKSIILTNQWDGDWQVAESEENALSEISSTIDTEVPQEIVVEVHAPDIETIYQGSTFSPLKGMEGLIYGDDITTAPPGDAEEIIAVESEVELDEASCPILEAANRGVGQQDEDIYPEVEDDISTIPPVDAEEITATESDVEQDEDISPEEVSIVMLIISKS